MSRRTATINQVCAFLIEQCIVVRSGVHVLRKSLFPILDQRRDEISERMHDIIIGLYEDWLWLGERIESVSGEIDVLSDREMPCQRLKSIPGIGPIMSTAVFSSIGTGEAFNRSRDFRYPKRTHLRKAAGPYIGSGSEGTGGLGALRLRAGKLPEGQGGHLIDGLELGRTSRQRQL
ncbi:MAG: transposase [Geminicoccaceae bacterium]